MTDRLDRIEAILERLSERQGQTQESLDRTNATIDRLAERQNQTQESLDRTNATIDRLAKQQDRTQMQLDQVAEQQDRIQQEMNANFEFLGSEVGQLIRGLVELRQQVADFGQLVEQDRSQAAIDRAEFRSTVEQLLRVLTERFTRNGDG